LHHATTHLIDFINKRIISISAIMQALSFAFLVSAIISVGNLYSRIHTRNQLMSHNLEKRAAADTPSVGQLNAMYTTSSGSSTTSPSSYQSSQYSGETQEEELEDMIKSCKKVCKKAFKACKKECKTEYGGGPAPGGGPGAGGPGGEGPGKMGEGAGYGMGGNGNMMGNGGSTEATGTAGLYGEAAYEAGHTCKKACKTTKKTCKNACKNLTLPGTSAPGTSAPGTSAPVTVTSSPVILTYAPVTSAPVTSPPVTSVGTIVSNSTPATHPNSGNIVTGSVSALATQPANHHNSFPAPSTLPLRAHSTGIPSVGAHSTEMNYIMVTSLFLLFV
jgi:hypothetical protein